MNCYPRQRLLAAFFAVALASMACSAGNDDVRDAGDASPDSTVEPALEDADTIPCEPRAVLQKVCQNCHTRPPRNGAPFPLVTRSNIVRAGADGREVRVLMIEQLEARRMPLAPVTIEEASRTILLDWLRAGAPAVAAQECSDAGTADADAAASSQERP